MLYYFDRSFAQELRPVPRKTFEVLGLKEHDLEQMVIKNIARLIPENQLMVIFRERSFQEEADIYAIDKAGNLHLFELKRWQARQENMLQVLRYGQIYGQYDYDRLEKMLRNYYSDQTLDLRQKHFEYFEGTITVKLKESDFNRDQYFIVITDGVDLPTLRAIRYWTSKQLNLRSLVYRVYEVNKDLLVEFRPYNPEEEILLDEPEGFYMVNTNLTWNLLAYRDMLTKEKASAWGDRKYAISAIKKGDTVFLYHNRVGVIAFGKALEGYKQDDPNEEYYVPLKFDWKIDPSTEPQRAVSPSEINEKLNAGYRFRQTVWSCGEDMARAVRQIAAHK